MLNTFTELLNELNSYDASVGLYPVSDATEVKDIAETEYKFNVIGHDINSVLIELGGQHFNIENNNGEWIAKNKPVTANIDDEIEIVGFYDEIAWYSKMIGHKFKVIAVDGLCVKVKRGNGKISYYVGQNDYKVIKDIM